MTEFAAFSGDAAELIHYEDDDSWDVVIDDVLSGMLVDTSQTRTSGNFGTHNFIVTVRSKATEFFS